MARIRYIPNRVIDTNGIADGATIGVYQTGTLTPVSIYSDAGFSNALANPYTVVAGAAVPEIFANYTPSELRVRVVSSGGSVVSDDDPFDPSANAGDLASASGAAQVGVQQTGSNKQARTVLEKTNDTLSLADVTGIDMTGTTDSATGLSNAVADGRTIVMPNGTLKLDTDVTISASQLSLIGNGETSVIDMSDGGSITISTTPTAIPGLSADVTAGGNSFTFASAHGLAEGDVFILYNPTDSSYSSYRTYYRDGAMFRVASVPTSTTVVIYGTSPRAFTAASVDCYKMAGGKVVIKGVRIIPPASGIPIQIDGHQGVVLEDIICDEGAADTGIDIWRCFDFSISRVQSTVLNGDAYPVIIANSQAGRISDCQLYSYRHCIGLGGRDGVCSVPVRDVIISDCSLYNNSASGEAAADIHGNCEDIVYNNCILNSVAKVGGRNVRYDGCTIFGRPPATFADGLCVSGSEVVGGTVELLNCRFITFGNGSTFGTIYADVSGRSQDLNFIVRNCTIVSRGSGASSVRMVMLALGSTAGSYRVDTHINGLTYVGSAAAQVLNLTGTADISSISSHIVEGVTAPSGTALLGATTAANYGAGVPLRLQKQTGTVTLSAASGTPQTVSSYITFRYSYPRAPQAFATAVGAVNSNRLAHGSMFALEATRLRVMIESGDQTNWSATADRVVSWSAELAEL